VQPLHALEDLRQRRWAGRAELDELCGHRLSETLLGGLWVAGELDGLRAPCVAVVGTRVPSDDGRRRARQLASELARSGVCVISGLALGVDGAAHEGSLAAGAPTIGVLGGGHDHFFPPRHRELAGRIVAGGGAVVSPFEPGNHPEPWQFLARNAVIAALADAVVVVEAAARSGALNTAGHAGERGVPVLAFPGDVDRPKAAGCNALIRDGATLVRDAVDVLAALPAIAPPPPAQRRATRREPSIRPDDPADVGLILRALADRSHDAASLADTLAVAPQRILALLTELELAGRITRGPDGYALVRQ
jgi:DNA processing protein